MVIIKLPPAIYEKNMNSPQEDTIAHVWVIQSYIDRRRTYFLYKMVSAAKWKNCSSILSEEF